MLPDPASEAEAAHPPPGGPDRPTGPDWFARVGELARSIGTDRFHQRVIDVLGSTIPHASNWIIRFSRVAPPDVIHTSNVPGHVVDFYRSNCADIDPFSAHWKAFEEPGVRTLSRFSTRDDTSVDASAYRRLFLPVAGVSDELGVFFSTVGQSSLGLFLERERGRFSDAEVGRAKLVFPLLNGFHKTHVGRIFNRLRYSGDAIESGLSNRPTLVQDRYGLDIFATPSWQAAAAADEAIGLAVASVHRESAVDVGEHTIKIEHFDRYFPLAPSGRMFVLTPRETAGPADGSGERQELEQGLTNLERKVFDLIMQGMSTGEIAQAIGIGKGTVKKYRHRIYGKAGAASGRDLVLRFRRT